jgi:hypothetical protein
MVDKPVKIPEPDHPITVEKNTGRVVVKVAAVRSRRNASQPAPSARSTSTDTVANTATATQQPNATWF